MLYRIPCNFRVVLLSRMLEENAKIKIAKQAYVYGNVYGIIINSRKLESLIHYSVLFRKN